MRRDATADHWGEPSASAPALPAVPSAAAGVGMLPPPALPPSGAFAHPAQRLPPAVGYFPAAAGGGEGLALGTPVVVEFNGCARQGAVASEVAADGMRF